MAYPNNPANSPNPEVITSITANFGLYTLPYGIKAQIGNVPPSIGQMALLTDSKELAIFDGVAWYYLPFTGTAATGVITDGTTITGTGVVTNPLKTGPLIPIGGTIGWTFTASLPPSTNGEQWAPLDSAHSAYNGQVPKTAAYATLQALFAALGFPWGDTPSYFNLPPLTATIMRIA